MITVVIPTYNHESYIVSCLEAVVRINLTGKRIIVIDDGSLDNTLQEVNGFIAKFPEHAIEVISKENSGLVSSLNMGLEKSESEFIYMVASDDIPVPAGVEHCVRALLEDKNLAFCIGGGKNFFEGESKADQRTPIYKKEHFRFFSLTSTVRGEEIFYNYPSPILLQSSVFRVDALRRIGGWDPTLIWDDYPTFVKLLKQFPQRDKDFLFDPHVDVVLYRQHELNSYRNVTKQFNLVSQTLKELCPSKLLNRSLGRALGFYMLVGLRAKDAGGVLTLFRQCSWSVRIFSMWYAAKFVLAKLLRF